MCKFLLTSRVLLFTKWWGNLPLYQKMTIAIAAVDVNLSYSLHISTLGARNKLVLQLSMATKQFPV